MTDNLSIFLFYLAFILQYLEYHQPHSYYCCQPYQMQGTQGLLKIYECNHLAVISLYHPCLRFVDHFIVMILRLMELFLKLSIVDI